MLIASLILFALVLIVLVAAVVRGLGHIDEILVVDSREPSISPARR